MDMPESITLQAANSGFRIVDVSAATPHEPDYWEPIVVPCAVIDAEIERLAALPEAPNGRRSSMIVHPRATAPGLGFAPGIDVTINVLKPGEHTVPLRRNSNLVEMCIRGTGRVTAGDQRFDVVRWDVWNLPAMQAQHFANTGDDLFVRLSYSNAPLLEKMECYFVEENPQRVGDSHGSSAETVTATATAADARMRMQYARENAPNLPIGDNGARLCGYEYLVDIQVVENKALHWPWQQVEPHVPLHPGTNQRPIMLMYNPATERRNGTTHSFFATIAATPPNAKPRPVGPGHRHSSVAINYWFQGKGESIVNGRTVKWTEGDLMLSGPAWSEHAHYPGPGGMAVLTIQDHPLQIGMESLIWQEEMDGAILALGSEAGVTGFTGPRQRGD